MDPPLSPDSTVLPEWDGEPVAFGETVSYSCAHSGLFFFDDRDLGTMDLATCNSDGTWTEPDPWPRCAPSKNGPKRQKVTMN